ncbi:MAG: rhomboid family intramembrane serine protease, partial [Gemmataceae bacterium]|nr:rhomboid family intramembrane serine protease [Gemmataceae bacterium]
MADVSTGLVEMVLRDLATAKPEPWYPADYARATGIQRSAIDDTLDQLRLADLVRLTDWVQGRGQGYLITPLGEEVLANPRLMTRLREGKDISRRAARDEEAQNLRTGESTWSRGEAIRAALLNPAQPTVTKILLVLNIAAFVWGLILATQANAGNEYLAFGTNHPAIKQIRDETGILHVDFLTKKGEWWRLVTYCFVHIGLIHLLMNMFVLYSLGGVAETLWGSWRFLALYLISGIVGGVAQILADPRPSMGGASGAICGLLGSMGTWVAMNKAYLPPRLASEWMRNIMTNVLLIVFISLMPGVSWAGHLGGGVGGVLVSI